MNRLTGREPLTGVTRPAWPDVPASHWAFGQVEEASTSHLFESGSDGAERLKGYLEE